MQRHRAEEVGLSFPSIGGEHQHKQGGHCDGESNTPEVLGRGCCPSGRAIGNRLRRTDRALRRPTPGRTGRPGRPSGSKGGDRCPRRAGRAGRHRSFLQGGQDFLPRRLGQLHDGEAAAGVRAGKPLHRPHFRANPRLSLEAGGGLCGRYPSRYSRLRGRRRRDVRLLGCKGCADAARFLHLAGSDTI